MFKVEKILDRKEQIKLIWKNSTKSKSDLIVRRENEAVYNILVSIIKGHEHIEFIEQ